MQDLSITGSTKPGRPSPVSRDELAEVLWPDAPREKGRHLVRQALWVLRGAIGEDLLDNEDPLSLREGALKVDLHRFVSALTEGRIHDARDLWRGPVLDNFVLPGANRWNHWKEELRADVEHRFCRALLHEAEAQRLRGDSARALAVLEQAIEVEPSTQAAHLGRIELLLELLRTDAAREALADARRVLGTGPAEATALDAMEERLELVIQEERSRVQEAEGFPLEFVGRSEELATLRTLWRDALLARAGWVDHGHTGDREDSPGTGVRFRPGGQRSQSGHPEGDPCGDATEVGRRRRARPGRCSVSREWCSASRSGAPLEFEAGPQARKGPGS